MTSVNSTSRPAISPWHRFRGVFAAVAAVGFFGTAVVAPLAMPSTALADDEFYERIHQEFVPEASVLALDVSVSPLEEIPEPTPVVAAAASAPARHYARGARGRRLGKEHPHQRYHASTG